MQEGNIVEEKKELKIALIGSAPSSVQLAPYGDPSWQIWACSPGAQPHVKRCDVWWEMHRRQIGAPWFATDYINWMAKQKRVIVVEPWPEIPNHGALDWEGHVEEHGPYFFTSTVSWMFAQAIKEGATHIGLWGIDMAAREEWAFQRSGCQYFIWEAQKRGIKVILPPESDLWMPPPLYGVQEVNPHHARLMVRRAELQARLADAQNRYQAVSQEVHFLQGAFEDNDYHLFTWVSHPKSLELAIGGPKQLVEYKPKAPQLNLPSAADAPQYVAPLPEMAPELEDLAPKKPKRRRHKSKANGAAEPAIAE